MASSDSIAVTETTATNSKFRVLTASLVALQSSSSISIFMPQLPLLFSLICSSLQVQIYDCDYSVAGNLAIAFIARPIGAALFGHLETGSDVKRHWSRPC